LSRNRYNNSDATSVGSVLLPFIVGTLNNIVAVVTLALLGSSVWYKDFCGGGGGGGKRALVEVHTT
jgi:hypothetical protein